jgi:hypothetical protein
MTEAIEQFAHRQVGQQMLGASGRLTGGGLTHVRPL